MPTEARRPPPPARLESRAEMGLAAGGIVALAWLAYVGSHARMMADDYCSAATTARMGVLESTLHWYMTWSNRYSASFLDAVAGALGPAAPRFQPTIVLVSWLVALVMACRRVLGPIGGSSWGISIALATVVILSTLQLTPDVAQSLYWGQGMRSVVPPLILGAVLVAQLAAHPTGGSGARLLASCLGIATVAFIAGGFSETYCVVQGAALGSAFVLAALLRRNPPLIARLGSAVLATALSLIVMLLSPGNANRKAALATPPVDPLQIATTARWTTESFALQLLVPENLATLLATIAIAFLLGRRLRPQPAEITLSGAAGAAVAGPLMVYVAFLPAAFALSSAPPPRTWIIPTHIFVLCAVAGALSLGTAAASASAPRRHGRSRIEDALLIGLAIAVALAAGIRAQAQLAPMRSYAAGWDALRAEVASAKARGRSAVAAHLPPNPARLRDLGDDPDRWVTPCAEEYLGIRLAPEANEPTQGRADTPGFRTVASDGRLPESIAPLSATPASIAARAGAYVLRR